MQIKGRPIQIKVCLTDLKRNSFANSDYYTVVIVAMSNSFPMSFKGKHISIPVLKKRHQFEGSMDDLKKR